jgi:hypothetical protein
MNLCPAVSRSGLVLVAVVLTLFCAPAHARQLALGSSGIEVQPLDSVNQPLNPQLNQRAKRSRENGERGLFVVKAPSGSDVKVGDVISAINDQSVATLQQAHEAIAALPAHSSFDVMYTHDGASFVGTVSPASSTRPPPAAAENNLAAAPATQTAATAKPSLAPLDSSARQDTTGAANRVASANGNETTQSVSPSTPAPQQTPLQNPAVDGPTDELIVKKLKFLGMANEQYKRGRPLVSTGGQIPIGTTLYPIRLTSLAEAGPTVSDLYFFEDEFGEWKCLWRQMGRVF